MALNMNRGTMSTNIHTDVQVRQMDPRMYRVMAENTRASFVSLLRLIGFKRSAAIRNSKKLSAGAGEHSKNVKSFRYEWEDFFPGSSISAVKTAANSSATSVAVTTNEGIQFQANDLILNKTTMEQMLVTAVSGDTLTVIRGWGTANQGTSGEALTVGDELILVGNAWTEGTYSAEARSYNPRLAYNYTQIFKRAVENTGTNEEVETYGNVNKLQFQRQEEWYQFLVERSRAYYTGKRVEFVDVTNGGRKKRTTAGLDSFIQSNVMVASALTYTNFMNFSKLVYRKGGAEKLLVCNSDFAQLVQEMVMDNKIQFAASPKMKEFGLNVKRLSCIHGDMDIMMDRTMDDLYTKPTAFALETDLIEEMILRPDIWRENVQAPDYDGRKDEVIGECGLKVISEERHGKLIISD